jgi:tRNA pseudouridine55 synthase
MNSIINVYKPVGIGSTDILNYIKREYKRIVGKNLKIGHGGTLDPFAEGVLIVGIGDATKQLSNFLSCQKTYEAEICLGMVTDTFDCTGSKTKMSDEIPDAVQVIDIVSSFKGVSEQTPPNYSAIHVNGKRAYDLAREGVSFELKKRQIEIFDIQVLDYSYPFVKIRVTVSGGTYIRSIAYDIGQKLGCGAYLEKLVRTQINEYHIKDSITREELVKRLSQSFQ